MPRQVVNRAGKQVGGTLAPRSKRTGTGQVDTLWRGQANFDAVGATGTFTSTDIGGFRYLTFTASGSMTVLSDGSAEVLVVAGGGGGGRGGGGAGGVRLATGNTYIPLEFSSGTSTITIGNGGTGVASDLAVNGGSGGTSSIVHAGGTLSASGGGGGGHAGGVNGGSGGGKGNNGGVPGTGNSGGYTPAEGKDGGPNDTANDCSGGGGYSAAATNRNGGEGLDVSTVDANLDTVLGATHVVVASGGGGAANCNNGGTVSVGGTGAGAGGYGGGGGNGTSYGSGAGGATMCFGNVRNGGNGKSGVIVIRWPL